MSLQIDTQKNNIRVCLNLYGDDVKKNFSNLHQNKDDIENELGYGLKWREMEGKKMSMISLSKNVSGNIKDRETWEDCFVWFKEKAESFHKVYSPRVKQL